MFRKYPYWGWLIAGVVLWSIAILRYHNHSRQIAPAGMAKTIEEDIQTKEKLFNQLLKDVDLIERIFKDSLTDNDVEKLSKQPYYLYAYKNGTLSYWNTNKILADCIENKPTFKEQLLFNEKGVFITRCYWIKNKARHLTALFPVMFQYPFENKYLANEFAAGSYIPANTRIHSTAVKGGYSVKNTEGETLFYIKFNPNSLPEWIPDLPMLALLIAALLTTIAWLQLISINVSRRRSNILGIVITIVLIAGVRLLTYIYGMPFNLSSMPIFSPLVYATSTLHPSMGALLLNALCFLWIIAYIIGNISVEDIDFSKLHKNIRYPLAVLLSLVIITFAFTFINMINSLVVDSAVSFDVSHFYSINKFTIYALITIGIITISCCLLIYFLNLIFTKLISNQRIKYLLIAATGIIVILLSDVSRTGNLSYFLLGWLLLFIILLDVKKLAYTNDVLAPHMIFWAFFVCAFCTAVLQYFSDIKEKTNRINYAEVVAQQRDHPLEDFVFNSIAQTLQNDHTLKAFIENPDNDARRQLNERFETLYFGTQLNKYQTKVYIYDANGNDLYNSDTLSYTAIRRQLRRAKPTTDSNLYYKEYAQDGHYYIGIVPIYNSDSNSSVSYLYLDLAIKESTGESVYPELLQPQTLKTTLDGANYSYAIYANHRLLTQTNDYTFPIFFNEKIAKDYKFVTKDDNSELWYKTDDNKVVIVVHNQKIWLESITLFSYLFGIQVLVAILIVLYKSTISFLAKPKRGSRLINFTLRRRIHFSMLGIVLVSFLIIGVVTIIYFTLQYKQNTRNKLLGVMQAVERSVAQNLDADGALSNPRSFNQSTNTAAFKYFITGLANAQKVDINIYNASGILNVTSQDNIYDRALLARIMRQDAYHELWSNKKSLLMQDENIGKLSHLSCYVPIRDEAGATMGYINIPYFSSQKELSYQISNILVALINLYAFIFLLSGMITVFITRWITRSFNVVIERFEKLNLSENELIEWPYEDEIGLLVQEYNKMVKKVEANAMLMARNERETAWREMAKQVAHEIKNPLTPMKLNIQYLQQALKNNYENVRELTIKVSESLIEQIDNLSYIASEFSNFAKMPEAVPENIEVNELIERVAELYLDESEVKVETQKSAEGINVYADRSQLLRVLTNLLQNAVQSIPEGREALVKVSVETQGADVLIAIADNGTGIDSEIVDKIFQPYFTTKTSGTGLGLAMTRKIIEFWKGKIWFDTTEGKGTTFYIRMPITAEA